MFNLVNSTRAAKWLPAFQRDPTLDAFAREWSAVQSTSGNIFHRTNLGEIAAATTPAWQAVAENVGTSSNVEAGAIDTLHVAFMNSQGHSDNVLGNYNRVGIGVVIGTNGTFITLNFLLGPALPGNPPPEGPPRTWAESGFTSITPVRLIDTRSSGAIAARGTLAIRPGDIVGAAATATAVAVNVTVVNPRSAGFVTVFPCGSPLPTASSLNHVAGDIRANLVEVALGSNESLCIYSQTGGHFVVDLSGYFRSSAGSEYLPSQPARLLDTRNHGGRVQQAVVAVSGASSAAFNVTATDGVLDGFVTVWPCDAPMPTASNLNYRAGETVPNLVMSKMSATGQVCFYTSTPAHLVIDLQGKFVVAAGRVVAADPRRALDTRVGLGHVGPLKGNPNTPGRLDLQASGHVPANAIGAILNVTVTEATAVGWLTVYPCAEGRPTASNLNYSRGQTVANNVIAKLDSNGEICLASLSQTHAIIDVVGWLI